MASLTTTIELLPFPTPTDVVVKQMAGTRGNGFSPSPKLTLNQLDYATLDALCKEYRDTVFKTAGIRDSAPSATRSAYVNASQFEDRTSQRD
jgi:hypothetical protein